MKKAVALLTVVLLAVLCAVCSCPALAEDPAVPLRTVFFGRYEQDNNPENGPEPIEWIVLEEKDGSALLLSRYALDARPYNEHYGAVAWENSTLRNWLNGSFLYLAFSGGERGAILASDVDNTASQGNPEWETDGGANTRDQVFLLSYHEAVEEYLAGDSSRICVLTPYAAAGGAFTSSNFQLDGESVGTWWLRSPGSFGTLVSIVYYDGTVTGNRADYYQAAVRPALRVDLNAEIPDIEEEKKQAEELCQKGVSAMNEENYEQAAVFFAQSADLGNDEALVSLGFCFSEGLGVAQDYEKAVTYYQIAADMGNPYAICNLGTMYENGHGVKQDYDKAFDYYKQAVDMGNPNAMFNLGTFYYTGSGGRHYPKIAADYWEQAADLGFGPAQHNIGILYLTGEIVEKDYGKAVHYFQLAADQGISQSAYALSECYKYGWGVEQSDEKSLEYYRIAQGE